MLDDNAKSEMSYKQAIVNNIIDLKLSQGCKDSRDDIEAKYIVRQMDSLVDTINDLRNEIVNNDNVDRVDDPTLTNKDAEASTDELTNQEDTLSDDIDSKYSVFYK